MSASKYTNNVTMEKDSTEIGTASASVTPWISSLSKTGNWATNMEAGTIQWQVNYNAGLQAANATEAVIYDLVVPGDSIPAWATLNTAAQSNFDSETTYNKFIAATDKALNQALVSGSVQVTTDQNADGTTDAVSCSTIEEVPLYNTSSELVAYLVKVTVAEPTHKIIFKYQTQVTDPVLLLETSTSWNRAVVKVADVYGGASGSIAWNNTFFTKEALVADDDNESDLPGATVAAKPAATATTDEGAKTVFNYSDQTAIFKLAINPNKLNLTNLGQSSSRGTESKITLTDTLPVGWEIATFADTGTYAVYDEAGNLAVDLFTTADAVAGNTVYTFTLEGTDIAKLDGATYYVYLKAALSEPEHYFNVNDEYTFTNEATVSFTAWDLSLEDTQNVIVISIVFDKDNELQSDGYVLWRITYNPYGLEKIGDYIVDTLPVGLELEAGTAIAYPITQWNEDGSYVVSTTPIDAPESYISYNVTTRQLTFRFPDSSTGYVLQYVTVVTADANGTLTNQAELYYNDSLTEEADDTYTVTSADAYAVAQLTGRIALAKIDGITGDPITGNSATFTLYNADKTEIVRVVQTDSDGNLLMRGLPVGDYILMETNPPSGYLVDAYKEYAISVTKETSSSAVTTIDGVTVSDGTLFSVKNYPSDAVGQLTITKSVSGNQASKTDVFTFTISFYEQGTLSSQTYSYIDQNGNVGEITGTGTFTLSADEQITIVNILLDTTYTVTEAEDDNGYTASSKTVTNLGEDNESTQSATGRTADGTIVPGTTYVTYNNYKNSSDSSGGDSSDGDNATTDSNTRNKPTGGDRSDTTGDDSITTIPDGITPTSPGNTIESGDDGTYIEIGDDGVPLGTWQDDGSGVWTFTPTETEAATDTPTATNGSQSGVKLPKTGSWSMLAALVTAGAFCAAGVLIGRKKQEDA